MTKTVYKAYSADVVALGERSIQAICSTGNVDQMGEIVEQQGADLSVYKNNPIVLFSHNPEHPVGTASNVRVERGMLLADIEFAAEGVSAKADEICGLVKAGILKSISIGFDPTDMEPINPSRPRGPQRYKKWTLCEISIVAIPANTDAEVTAKAVEARVTKDHPKIQFKGLYGVGCLAELMSELGWQHSMAACEAACEGDGSEVPGKLAEVLHGLGEALIAMTQEEVSECLANADAMVESVDGTDKSTNAAVRKFRAGVSVMKAGRAVSKATAETIQAAQDSHGALHNSLAVHDKCMKALFTAQTSDGQQSGATTKALSPAEPGTDPGAINPTLDDAKDSHNAVQANAVMHAKCMKALGAMVPGSSGDPPDNSQVSQSQADTPASTGGNKPKDLKTPMTKAQRMRVARALELGSHIE